MHLFRMGKDRRFETCVNLCTGLDAQFEQVPEVTLVDDVLEVHEDRLLLAG